LQEQFKGLVKSLVLKSSNLIESMIESTENPANKFKDYINKGKEMKRKLKQLISKVEAGEIKFLVLERQFFEAKNECSEI